jgi:glycosyltransferase involved in cell wall biosynthesis
VKVAHVVPSFHPSRRYGGAVESTYQLCRHLASVGCTVRVLTTDADGETRSPVPRDREVDLGDGLTARYCARVAWESASPALVRRVGEYAAWADVVHLTAVYSFPTIPTLLAAWISDKRVVWSPRGGFQEWPGSRRRWLKRLWNDACRRVRPRRLVLHVTSNEEREETLECWPDCEAVLVPNGVELPATVIRPDPDGRVRLLYVGRIDPKKGIENLVDACQLLRRRGTVRWSLRIAGDGEPDYVESIRRRIAANGLQDAITMVGWVTAGKKERLFASSDVLVCPSYTENFGNVVTEALAHAVPVIASRGTPWAEVEKVGCGLWVENDAESLAEAIERVSGAPLSEWGRTGRRWMEQEYAWSTVANRMRDLYVRLLEAP